MQQAQQLDTAHREQIVRGVLRWWRSTDLARSWAQWHAVVTVLLPKASTPAVASSPQVSVSLA